MHCIIMQQTICVQAIHQNTGTRSLKIVKALILMRQMLDMQ